ncbi:hypothetical protein BD779DRAFT_1670187 [Infundibulicybe gibba]|nr:hypothetical protein BD779DRAFT_1670187 [Infundibulicybe gibba]
MSYNDPYTDPYSHHQHVHYDEPTADYPAYSTNQPPHQTYDQGGPGYDASVPQRQPTQRSHLAGASMHDDSPVAKESSGFDHRGLAAQTALQSRGKKTAKAMRDYRYEFRGPLWTKGGRGRCVGRFCCCTLLIAAFLFVSIILALALWIRPPSVTISDVSPIEQNGSTIQLKEQGLTINLGVNISVKNPNYFSVDFTKIKAEIFYPINNTLVGGGSQSNIVFKSNAQTNITFPFTIDYDRTLDPNNQIIIDLAQKCGITGNKSNLTVQYKITLGIRILIVTISPVISNSFTFMCPINPSDLQDFIKKTGLNLGGLIGS